MWTNVIINQENALSYKTYRTDLKFPSSNQQHKCGEKNLYKLLKEMFASW